MAAQLCFLRATFDGKGLFVTDRSPELPGPFHDLSLLPYLNILSVNGWNAVRGKFEGWEVVLYFERQTEMPYKTGSMYLMPMFQQFPFPKGLSKTAEEHRLFMDKMQEMAVSEGWQILAGPKQLAKTGLWTIAIWVKTYPIP